MRGNIHLSSLQTLLYEGKKQTASQQQHRGTIKIKFTVNRTYSWGKTLTVSILIICKALGGRTSAPSQMTAAACTHLRQCGFLPYILKWVIWSWHMLPFHLVLLGTALQSLFPPQGRHPSLQDCCSSSSSSRGWASWGGAHEEEWTEGISPSGINTRGWGLLSTMA